MLGSTTLSISLVNGTSLKVFDGVEAFLVLGVCWGFADVFSCLGFVDTGLTY